MITRRHFLANSSLLSLSPIVPSLLMNSANAAEQESDSRILVVIQLDGGNDGLNTVVPVSNDLYAKNRVDTRITASDAHKLNDDSSLHSSMKAAHSLFDDGRLSIVQGVGYPNPDRSHFRSMRIWQTTSFDDANHSGYGWLGRALDTSRRPGSDASAVYVGTGTTPVALWARRANTLALSDEADLHLRVPRGFDSIEDSPKGIASIEQFVSRSVLSAYSTAGELSQRKTESSSVEYPDSKLASQLKLVSQLIRSDISTRVYYATHGGFDTHADQRFTHSQLLREFSSAVKAFLDELKSHQLDDRVLVLAFSEFGRRVKENASKGTDHGTAGPVFVAGSSVQSGLIGTSPDLSDLDDGDIKSQFDFRQLYATILDDWLNIPSENILGHSFERLPIL